MLFMRIAVGGGLCTAEEFYWNFVDESNYDFAMIGDILRPFLHIQLHGQLEMFLIRQMMLRDRANHIFGSDAAPEHHLRYITAK